MGTPPHLLADLPAISLRFSIRSDATAVQAILLQSARGFMLSLYLYIMLSVRVSERNRCCLLLCGHANGSTLRAALSASSGHGEGGCCCSCGLSCCRSPRVPLPGQCIPGMGGIAGRCMGGRWSLRFDRGPTRSTGSLLVHSSGGAHHCV